MIIFLDFSPFSLPLPLQKVKNNRIVLIEPRNFLILFFLHLYQNALSVLSHTLKSTPTIIQPYYFRMLVALFHWLFPYLLNDEALLN